MHKSIFPPAIGDLQRFLLLFSGRVEGGSHGQGRSKPEFPHNLDLGLIEGR